MSEISYLIFLQTIEAGAALVTAFSLLAIAVHEIGGQRRGRRRGRRW